MDPANSWEPEDLYFQPSLGRFWHSVCQLCLLNGCYYIRSGCCFQCIQTDAANSQALSLWKNVRSSHCLHIVLKQTQPTCRSQITFIFNLHWVGSSIQFVGCTCLTDMLA